MTNFAGLSLSPSAGGADRHDVTTRRGCRSRLAAGIVATLLAGGLISGSAATASAAALPDPERYSVTPTGWGYYFTADELTINTWAMQNNMRIVDVEVISPTVFTVVMVHNAGIYQRGLTAAASWTTNETSSSLLAKLSGKRLAIHRQG